MTHQTPRGYAGRLDGRLRAGVGGLPKNFCFRHLDYLVGLRRPDGGFPGRDGSSDLYYTHFALQALDLLAVRVPAAMPPRLMESVWRYVGQAAIRAYNVIDAYCALRCLHILARHDLPGGPDALKVHVLRVLQQYRAPDGGYSSHPGRPPGVYQTFLAGLCFGLIREEPPDLEDDAALLRESQCPGGGFMDTPGEGARQQGGANPTAAAVGFLLQWDRSPPEVFRSARSFLSGLQRPDGGFGAHARAPVSDLLSTFTALFTLAELDALSEIRLADAARFARRLSRPGGGFCGTAVQEEPDAEYTFYGLGSLAVLAAEVQQRTACCCPGGECCG